jgi:ubiquinone/menaquinone biosynthesis C-methylase UbiE
MSPDKGKRICPVERAGILDFSLRKLVHNPKRILSPYIKEGMTALDLGCGPGFFTLEMARLVGKSGKVIAADLQEGMLEKLREKLQNRDWANTIGLHHSRPDGIGLTEKFDFILVFYMLHEVPDQAVFLRELKTLLKANGKVLIVEPAFHVSEDDFKKSISTIEQSGFAVIAEPGIRFSRAVVIGH